MSHNHVLFHGFIIVLLIYSANGERTKDKMYEKIDGVGSCIRRLNSTHQTGCTSDQSGSTGVIHVIETESDIDFILEKGTAPPYIPIMPINFLKPSLMKKLKKNAEKISGLVVHKNISTPEFFSNEAKCPNSEYGLGEMCDSELKSWNPHGTEILHGDFSFPIFLLQDDENLFKIRKCFERFNNFQYQTQYLRPLCAIELSSFMFATVNSQTCMRRSKSVLNFTPTNFCDPLGDRNVWFTLFPWNESISDVIIVTAKMDSTSLFNEVTPGAKSAVTGMVTLLSTASLLNQMVKGLDTYKKNVLFVLVNGESYDYIGSQRLVYDIVNEKFPMERDDMIKNQLPHLKLSDIMLMLEIGQIGNSPLYMHHVVYNDSNTNQQLSTIKQLLLNTSKSLNVSLMESSRKGKLPPASLQTFLKEKSDLLGLVVSDHNEEFTNHYYNSIYDDNSNIMYKYLNITEDDALETLANDTIQSNIARVANLLARSLYQEVTGNHYTGNDAASIHIIDELLHCYLDTANCKIYKAVTLKKNIDNKPLSLYVGVVASGNIVTTITGLAVAWLMHNTTNITEAKCIGDPHDPVFQYLWMASDLDDLNSTLCFSTTMNFSLAISPAFDIQDYDWSSGKYSSWTESVWRDLGARMFLKPSARHEIVTVCVGTITLLLSLVFVYFVKANSRVLFPREGSTVTPVGTSC